MVFKVPRGQLTQIWGLFRVSWGQNRRFSNLDNLYSKMKLMHEAHTEGIFGHLRSQSVNSQTHTNYI